MKYKSKIVILLSFMFFLSGCVTIDMTSLFDGRYSPSKDLDRTKGAIVGSISEGFLTQPHGLLVFIRPLSSKQNEIILATMGYKDEDPKLNILSNTFMYELPPGKYEVYKWEYYYYRGKSLPRTKPIVFTVKANEITYIGNFHGVALTMCLSDYNNYAEDMKKLRKKYPILKKRKVSNQASKIAFRGWPHEKSEDLFGRGKCK